MVVLLNKLTMFHIYNKLSFYIELSFFVLMPYCLYSAVLIFLSVVVKSDTVSFKGQLQSYTNQSQTLVYELSSIISGSSLS